MLKPVPKSKPATHEHSAFGGRVVFGMRFSTLGDQPNANALYAGIKRAGALDFTEDMTSLEKQSVARLQDAAADFSTWLTLTSSLAFMRWQDHPELQLLYEFWDWWLAQQAEPRIDYATLWDWRLNRLGWSVMDEWKRAYNGAQAVSLPAPRELLPDELLTEEERTDPNSSPGAKQAGPTTDNASSASPKANAGATA